MDRRSFTKYALGALGIAAFPKALASAGPQQGWSTEPLPPPPPVAPIASLPANGPLLARAKAALDRHAGRFQLRDRLAVADFSRPSRELRFHIVDLLSGRSSAYLVAHGKGSDWGHTGWLQYFSNVPESEASSEGAFRTADIYEGQHGQSMRLEGLDPSNDMAEARAIVIHGAPYVGENQIAAFGKLGRSQGCFALAPHLLPEVLALLGPGRLLYSGRAA